MNLCVQVLVATSTLAWGVNTPAHLVIIKGTEYYDAPSRRYVDFPITDVLQVRGSGAAAATAVQQIADKDFVLSAVMPTSILKAGMQAHVEGCAYSVWRGTEICTACYCVSAT